MEVFMDTDYWVLKRVERFNYRNSFGLWSGKFKNLRTTNPIKRSPWTTGPCLKAHLIGADLKTIVPHAQNLSILLLWPGFGARGVCVGSRSRPKFVLLSRRGHTVVFSKVVRASDFFQCAFCIFKQFIYVNSGPHFLYFAHHESTWSKFPPRVAKPAPFLQNAPIFHHNWRPLQANTAPPDPAIFHNDDQSANSRFQSTSASSIDPICHPQWRRA